MFKLTKFYRTHPILLLFIVTVVTPIMMAAHFAYSYLQTTVPYTIGERVVNGIQAPVSIARNNLGVTKIQAENDNDVFFALGYAHAQDRLWQLELQRRMSRGQLAEVFGKSSVPFDIYIRTLAIHEHAQKSLSTLSEAALASLDAYSKGINSFIEEANPLPVEFTLLNIQPKKWAPVDSIAWIKMFALSLSGNYQQDLNRLIVNQSLSPKKAKLFVENDDKSDLETASNLGLASLDNLVKLADLTKSFEQQWGLGGTNIGSNAWVVSAENSENGLATLSNDPHLAIELPSQWYVVDLQGAKLKVSGMSLVGLPIVMLGKNNHIGWGATNMMADTMDLYYEQLNVENINQYKRGDKWINFSTRNEIINVKSDFPAFMRQSIVPLNVQIRETDHGPIISDVIGKSDQPFSLQWQGFSDEDSSYDAFFQLNYATDWTSFKQAMSAHVSPVMNLFYVDNQQNIGYLGIGHIPLRAKGNGNVPVPGWLPEYKWQGSVPQSEMPHSFNPQKGYLLSANNKAVGTEYPYFITQDWAEPERAERIEQLLLSKFTNSQKLSLKDHEMMQADLLDLQVLKMLPELTGLESQIPVINEMLEHLKKWDGVMSNDSVAATIYQSWMRNLRFQLFADEFNHAWGKQELQRRQTNIVRTLPFHKVVRALSDSNIKWCDNIETDLIESCEEAKTDALQVTYHTLSKLFGNDMDDWTWGQAHEAIFAHRPFSQINGLDLIFERKTNPGGSPNTISMSSASYQPGKGYIQTVGATFRQIVQFRNDNKALEKMAKDVGDTQLIMNSTGQSGNFMSPHYDDMITPFSEHQYFQISDDSAQQSDVLTLVLAKDEK